MVATVSFPTTPEKLASIQAVVKEHGLRFLTEPYVSSNRQFACVMLEHNGPVMDPFNQAVGKLSAIIAPTPPLPL